METLILTTKLNIPLSQQALVNRPRLFTRMDAGLNGKLSLVSAPAGYGKTTLVTSWIKRRQTPAAWYSIDAGDNELMRFLAYLASAIGSQFPGAGESMLIGLQSPQKLPTERLLTTLINDVHEIETHFVLVLDDYHFIDSKPIHEALLFLLDHIPPQMHLIITGRSDPPFPLARLRVGGDLIEVRSADLRFTLEEASTFLHDVAGIKISPQDLQSLESRTEGWIAGLQLAAISMRGQEDVSGFVEAFKGSQRFVIDYLVEEVLNQQSAERQDFLMKTSILDRLNASLCDAVVELGESQEVLDTLNAESLFLIPLDSEGQWYRYHHLFADFLRQRLHQNEELDSASLHLRASKWFGQHDQISPALKHALAAREMDLALNLVEQNGMERIMGGEVNIAQQWLESIPIDKLRKRPVLNIYYAWVLFLTGQLNEAEKHLQDTQAGINEILDSPESEAGSINIEELQAEVLILRSFIIRNKPGGSAEAIDLAKKALGMIPEEKNNLKGLALMSLGTCYRDIDLHNESIEAYSAAVDLCLAAGNYLAAINAIYQLSRMYVLQGQLHQAAAVCRQGLAESAQRAEKGLRRLPVEGILHVGLGSVLYEWNDLKSAESYLQEGIRLGELSGFWDAPLMGRIFLSRVQQSNGEYQAALDTNEIALEAARTNDSHIAYLNMVTNRARLWIAEGDLAAAERWAQDVTSKSEKEVSYLHEFEQITLSKYHLACGEPQKALNLLNSIQAQVEHSGRLGTAIEVFALQSIALQALGDVDGAVAVMENALTLAQPENYTRTFLDLGPEVKQLLESLIKADGKTRSYGQNLLAAYPELETQPALDNSQVLVEPLSERELEVLVLMSQGLSGPEISGKLFVSLNTIKSHIKNIYSKLGVNKRFDAIERAKEFDLI